MADKWVLTRRLARSLSSSGLENIFGNPTHYVNDYFGRCVNKISQMNLDNRARAIQADLSTFVYDVSYNPNSQWSEMLWSHTCLVQLWEDLLANTNSVGEPLEILTQLVAPYPSVMNELSGSNRNYTFINSMDTNFLEKLMFANEDANQFGDIKYAVIDRQDIENGEADGQYDLVRLWSWFATTLNITDLTKYLDCVKVGGVFIINNPSDAYNLYESPMTAHFSPFYWLSRYIANDKRFTTYHVPHEIGVIVAKRIC